MLINKISLDDDGFKNAFLEGKFVIDCVEIKLTQNGSPLPRVYSSPGFILVTPEFGAEARMVVKRDISEPYDPLATLVEQFSVSSGVLFPETHFYSLEAMDLAGNIWTNAAVMPKFLQQDTAEVISFSCDHIETGIAAQSSTAFVHFVFSEDLKLPMDVHIPRKEFVRGRERLSFKQALSSGTMSGMQVHYHKCLVESDIDAYELFVLASDSSQFFDAVDARVLDAVRFCTAALAFPVMSEVARDGTRLIRLTKARRLNVGLVSAPLSGAGTSADFYKLMGCYYDHACRNATGMETSTLSKKLGGLYTLQGVWLDTIALLLCIAVEGILNDSLFKSLGKPSETLLGGIKALFEWVKAAPVDDRLRERARSAIGSMKSNRAVDKMHALAAIGAIDPQDIVSWKFVRNPSAHGSFQINENEIQELLDHTYRLVTMVHKLAFLIIGYSGTYTDCARPGWPRGNYDAAAILSHLQE